MNILETVDFRLKEGIEEADFLKSNTEVQAWVRSQPGFKKRMLTCKDGEWLDCVVWENKTMAEQAAQAFMADMCATDFINAIDKSSVKMHHREIMA